MTANQRTATDRENALQAELDKRDREYAELSQEASDLGANGSVGERMEATRPKPCPAALASWKVNSTRPTAGQPPPRASELAAARRWRHERDRPRRRRRRILQDGGWSWPILEDGDGDYFVQDDDGTPHFLDTDTVDSALGSYTDPADYVSREFYEQVNALSEPQPDPAEVEARRPSRKPKYAAQARAEQDAEWTTALAENMNLIEHRIGQKLTEEERAAIYKDASKTATPIPCRRWRTTGTTARHRMVVARWPLRLRRRAWTRRRSRTLRTRSTRSPSDLILSETWNPARAWRPQPQSPNRTQKSRK